MNNSDMPASPTKDIPTDCAPYYKALPSYGLTKRESFAMAAMQGLCANKDYITADWKEIITKESVIIADALLKELDK